jgi:tRNA threonylcarbamoyladenosine biosynthesis protein TsaB
VALVRDGVPIHTATLESLPGHSETLLYVISRLLDGANLTLDDVDLLAAGVGPGSFTGLRVGLAAMKGLHLSTGKPLLGVSSLLALSMNATGQPSAMSHQPSAGAARNSQLANLNCRLACAAIDARRGDVFAAVYRFLPPPAGEASILHPSSFILHPSAVLPEQMTRPEALIAELEKLREDVVCLGDAFISQPKAMSHEPTDGGRPVLMPRRPFMRIPPDGSLHFPSAVNVALVAVRRFERGETDNPAALEPRYVRPVDFKTSG